MQLYKKDLKGNILTWKSSVEDNGEYSTIITRSGILNGGLVEHKRNILSGKNIGKANETNHYQQALLEEKSDINDKLKSGYKSVEMLGITIDDVSKAEGLHQLLDVKLSNDDTTANGELLPMKCKPFVPNKMKYPCVAQPKINGCRGFVTGRKNTQTDLFDTKEYEIVFFAKRGDEYTIPTLQSNFEQNLKLAEFLCVNNIVLDGEFYIHGYPPPAISGACRNVNNPLNSRLGFIIFDLAIPTVIQSFRLINLLKLNIQMLDIPLLCVFEKDIRVICMEKCISDEAAKELMHYYIAYGAEGVVLRDESATYKFGKRPSTIMKLKETKDSEFQVVSISKNEGNDGAKFVCKNDINDELFEVSCIGSMTKQKHYVESKHLFIGKLAKVKFYERTDNGLPFNATLMYIL